MTPEESWNQPQPPLPDWLKDVLQTGEINFLQPLPLTPPPVTVNITVQQAPEQQRWRLCRTCRQWVRNKPILGTLHFCVHPGVAR